MVKKPSPFFRSIFMAGKKSPLLKKSENKKLYKGKFIYNDKRGETLEFPYRVEKGPSETIKLKDGQVISLPRDLIDHLRNSGKRPIYGHVPNNEGGMSIMKIGEEDRYTFDVTDFMDEEKEETPDVIDIEI